MAPSPSTGTFSGIALWLSPPRASSQHDYFSSLIKSLSSSLNTPPFDPHITLLSGLPASTPLEPIISSLARSIETSDLKRFKVEFKGIGTHHRYFQYLFAIVDKDNEGLLRLRTLVQEGLENDGLLHDDPQTGEKVERVEQYFPHASLVYGTDIEGERSVQEVMERMRKEGNGFEGGVSVGSAQGFQVEEVLVVMCEGKPEEWKVLGRVALE
ncbi:BZ3500_MvSof-1268-A1-R1_Chr1-1g01052 [Microbotryum saponariae]|uniref:BZ3500_MvSof-1268-A1-R1_Chr1-1g01052 protein n=1 Tax=Microbotryum saponariae TaxID=289078 RepID=A0A2X0K858_9BASI|nr:BZ3500_MvSof-1268-A1-R1_Chr1-1g01052 [Microbotryum saponariae]